jgi:septum formation protein
MIELPVRARLVLASGSPRRADLLSRMGLDFDIRPADIDESMRSGEDPVEYVLRLSIEKANAVDRRPGEIVLAADTTVELDGEILGKPVDDHDAARMLALLAGRTHRVHSGVTVISAELTTIVVTTAVTFALLTSATIGRYIATGEPYGKAGAYAIQGVGAALVESIDGSVTNVVGLPLAETLAMLQGTTIA